VFPLILGNYYPNYPQSTAFSSLNQPSMSFPLRLINSYILSTVRIDSTMQEVLISNSLYIVIWFRAQPYLRRIQKFFHSRGPVQLQRASQIAKSAYFRSLNQGVNHNLQTSLSLPLYPGCHWWYSNFYVTSFSFRFEKLGLFRFVLNKPKFYSLLWWFSSNHSNLPGIFSVG